MSGIQIAIKLDNVELETALDRAIAGGEDMRQPMGEIAEEWLDNARQRFAEERDPLGVPWKKRRVAEFNPSLAAADASRKVLHLTGAMERAMVPDFGSDFAQVGVLPSGGPGKYARTHNEGGEIVPKTGKALSFGGRLVSRVVMPKRQYLGDGPKEQQAVTEILGDWLRGLFGATS